VLGEHLYPDGDQRRRRQARNRVYSNTRNKIDSDLSDWTIAGELSDSGECDHGRAREIRFLIQLSGESTSVRNLLENVQNLATLTSLLTLSIPLGFQTQGSTCR
jgi:hypothetical protein